MIRLLALLICLVGPAAAQEFNARATVEAIRMDGEEVAVAISQPVRWRVFVEADSWRLVLDTSEVDWSSADPAAIAVDAEWRAGRIRAGWSRLMFELPGPMRIERAWMDTDVGTTINVVLTEGAGSVGPLNPQAWDVRPSTTVPTVQRRRQTGDRPLVIALDPGHGGVDPGAEAGGLTEAALMLRFARELSDVLKRRGHEVVLTRDGDEFVGLRGRSTIARAGQADLMLSLHADAVEGGGAEGATVYTLAPGNETQLAAEIAQRHGRDDLLLGVGDVEQGDEIARILVELARAETAPRSVKLADALVAGLNAAGIRLHKRPRLGGKFTVLKAPDIPSVLLELGFMSNTQDLANLGNPDWRSRMAVAIANGVAAWAEQDAAEALLLRQ
ncbi:N-acetylmuramoyl-L-alanine amidase [Jannaschia faecimaris]|uniref:N-acetylmuramoyl-L-alanine amidase n=1 Tax=Jannaschia faecimaris TaxID=1244108 RepID=A0A1H3RQW7_9RHOB|nr:N-acetylmuramoyl-L-alanine amidase [Jannaschia faecimaris]SDZ28102.1 N-acetylmuramoyl-L-alanine amidase [Jannaschia faecimaris]